MAWWNKRRQVEPSPITKILNYSDTDYTSFVADFVDGMDPGTRAHTAVAYQNILPIISAAYTVNKERGLEFTIEGFLSELWTYIDDKDEVRQRRYSWLSFAALVARLEKIARRDPSVVPQAATIWTIIATEYPRLKMLLPDSIVWKAKEKEWFDLSMTDGELIQFAVNHNIPPRFAKHEIVEKFARDLQLFYFPSKTRIGYVP